MLSFMATKTATPWGPASLVEELTVPQRSGDKRFASVVQLLEKELTKVSKEIGKAELQRLISTDANTGATEAALAALVCCRDELQRAVERLRRHASEHPFSGPLHWAAFALHGGGSASAGSRAAAPFWSRVISKARSGWAFGSQMQ